MKRLLILLPLVLACAKSEPTATVEKVWSTPASLTTSESVLFNPADELLYISCINGQPTDKDGNGFIARVNLKGEIVDSAWATGLNAPKGSGISGHSFYVTDIDQLVEISLETGEIVNRFPVEGARFLNDVTIAEDGTVYFSDSSEENSVIYRLQNGALERWLESEDISSPNGIFLAGKTLYVGSFSTGDLFAVDTETKSVKKLGNVGFGIDGLKRTPDGDFLVSDWVGKTALFSSEGKTQILLDTGAQNVNSADIEFIAEKNLVLIPTFFDNRVVAYSLKAE